MKTEYINVVMDAGPYDLNTGFVGCETDEGKSVKVDEWIERPDGFWALRLLIAKKEDKDEIH